LASISSRKRRNSCARWRSSGSDGDGTLGLKAIKERDGLTFAQISDGFGPGHSEMPNSAIAAGMVDFAIPVEQMGAKLVEFVHSAQLIARRRRNEPIKR
jgi:two-component system, chemotaxis family, CheB/CheR fusion protein